LRVLGPDQDAVQVHRASSFMPTRDWVLLLR
jgi:hypothetical protein